MSGYGFNFQATERVGGLLHAFWIVNRFPSLLAYNVGYLLLIISLSQDPTVLWTHSVEILVFFFGIVLMKAHASIADALHDYDKDRDNPQKSYVAQSVDTLGKMNAHTLMAVELIVGLALVGYLSYRTGNPLYVLVGITLSFFGYTYSYPPRFKERGVFNHVVTSSVDVLCILMPGVVLLAGGLSTTAMLVGGIVFLYSFAYHIMHQAGDTYYDRETGIETFTTAIGTEWALLLSAGLLGVAAVFALVLEYYLTAAVLVVFALNFGRIYRNSHRYDEQVQSDMISDGFDISRCATILNVALTANVFLLMWM